MLWMIAAILSAVFAGMTSILAKCGIKKTDSEVDFVSIKVPFTEFAKRFDSLLEEGKINEYISIPNPDDIEE